MLEDYSMIDSLKKNIQLARKQADRLGIWEYQWPLHFIFIRTIDFYLPIAEIYTDTGL